MAAAAVAVATAATVAVAVPTATNASTAPTPAGSLVLNSTTGFATAYKIKLKPKRTTAAVFSSPYLSDYEFTAALAERAKAITEGAELYLTRGQQGNEMNPMRLALLEVKYRTSPCKIIRTDNRGHTESISIMQLQKLTDSTPVRPA